MVGKNTAYIYIKRTVVHTVTRNKHDIKDHTKGIHSTRQEKNKITATYPRKGLSTAAPYFTLPALTLIRI
jgi:hypothetical protein